MRKKNFRNVASFFLKKKNLYLTIAISVVLFAILFSQIRSAILVLLLIIVTVAMKFFESYLPRGVNVDPSLFVLIVLMKAYSLPLALAVTIASFLIGIIVKGFATSRMSGENIIFPPIGYIAVAFFISFFQLNVFMTGMVAVVFYSALMTLLFGLAYGFPIFDIFIFWVTIVPFNYWLFASFGQVVLNLLR